MDLAVHVIYGLHEHDIFITGCQNPDLAKVLKGTGNSMLVEANPFDPFWGAGVSLASTDLWNPTKWKGANKLGRMLVELRDSL